MMVHLRIKFFDRNKKITKRIQQVFVKLQPGPWIIMQIGYTETFLVRNWILRNRPTL